MNRYHAIIQGILEEEVEKVQRPDLYRKPLFAVSDPSDPRYAQLKTLVGEWHMHPEELLPNVKAVITYFVPYTEEVTKSPSFAKDAARLWAEAYCYINDAFDQMGQRIAHQMTAEGYESYVIAGTHTYDAKDLKSLWSHRSAAVIAGLGYFGANRLVITEKGSSGRLCTILTTAPIPFTEKKAKDYCLRNRGLPCDACFKNCPATALQPNSFDRFLCNEAVLLKNAEQYPEIGFCDVCGKCISACPFAYMD